MLKHAITAGLLIATISSASASEQGSGATAATKRLAPGSFRLAQACGWYAISVCSQNRGGAAAAANRYGGYVIDTSSEAYPNFRPGWYCALEGPMNKQAANRRKREMQDDGADSAYIKNGC